MRGVALGVGLVGSVVALSSSSTQLTAAGEQVNPGGMTRLNTVIPGAAPAPPCFTPIAPVAFGRCTSPLCH